MGKNGARRVILHTSGDTGALAEEINAFYVGAVERRLTEWNLTAEQKIAVIDRLIAALSAREKEGSGG